MAPRPPPDTVAAVNRRGAILLGLLGLASAAAAFGLSSRSGGAEAAKTTTRATTTAPLRLTPKARKSVTAGPLTLVAGGDIAFSGAGASAATFAGIRRFLNGDIVFGNLEGTLATSGTPKCSPYGVDGCYTFRADPASAAALRGDGFTIMNLANNHALDYGSEAQLETIRAVRAAHLDYTGLPGQIEVVDAGGVKVACDRLRALSVGPEPARHTGDRRAGTGRAQRGGRRSRLHARGSRGLVRRSRAAGA